MPFGFRRKSTRPGDSGSTQAVDAAPQAEAAPDAVEGVAFDGLTEEWRLVGVMHIDGRLSDALNRREAIAIGNVSWAPVDGSGPFEPAPGLKSIDPYDLIVVLAGAGTLPPMSEAEKAAHKIHKVPYGVTLEAPPFRIVGTVYLFPGTEPERLLDRATEMFLPVTEAQAYYGDQLIVDPEVDVVLVNRFYLRAVQQVDNVATIPVAVPEGGPDAENAADEAG